MTTRRAFVLGGAASAFAVTDPFPFGIASGDPWPDGFVIWTRLANEGPVRWEVATDERMSNVVRRGATFAEARWGNSVHVELRGLAPGRWYWYRFYANGEASAVGRTRTAPAPGSLDPVRFSVASCQKWQDGHFTAYEHMANDPLDLVVHTGDYIYETASPKDRPRPHDLAEATTLDGYRARYALYKSDPHLRRVHELFPWIVTWDDHETADNYAGFVPDWDSPVETFAERRAAAYQAFYENMPLRANARPSGPHLDLYRRLPFGATLDLHVLDTRQYRADQPCGDKIKPDCAERRRADRTMLGPVQERWLFDGLGRSRAKWNALAQQVIFSLFDQQPGEGELYSMDKWDGYPAARDRIVAEFARLRVRDPNFSATVLSGDNHNHWMFDIEHRGKPVASEFAGTSIASNGDGADISGEYGAAVRSNPHLRFHSSRRGYLRCDVSAKAWHTDFLTLPYVTRPGAPVETKASFTLERGRPGAQRS